MLAEDTHDLASFARIQCDELSTVARRLLTQVWRLRAGSACAEEALDILRRWDGHMQVDSAGATIYQTWLTVLSEQVARSLLPAATLPWLLGEQGFHPLNDHPSFANRFQGRLVEACCAGDARWLRGRSWDDVLQDAFRESVTRLRVRLGSRPSEWRWGRLHRLRLRHSLRLPGWNLGSIAMGGDSESVNQTAVLVRNGLPGPVSLGATWRFLTRLACPDEAMSAHFPGQSGHPASPHYRDGISGWLAGAYHRHWQAAPRNVLHLIP